MSVAMAKQSLTLELLLERYAICQLPPEAEIPAWAQRGELLAIIYTPEELSLVCVQRTVPPTVRAQRNWRALRVRGVLELSMVGVMASLAAALAGAGVSLFAVSTYNTDYLLVEEGQLPAALQALAQAGHSLAS